MFLCKYGSYWTKKGEIILTFIIQSLLVLKNLSKGAIFLCPIPEEHKKKLKMTVKN